LFIQKSNEILGFGCQRYHLWSREKLKQAFITQPADFYTFYALTKLAGKSWLPNLLRGIHLAISALVLPVRELKKD
jgi:hypothetical protein